MPRQIVHQNEFITIYYIPEKKTIHHEIHQFISGGTLRDALNAGLEALRVNQAHKWLSDDRKNGALLDEDDQWTRTIWFPAALKAGFRFWAIVTPEKIAGKANMQRRAATQTIAGAQVQMFDNPIMAMNWLESCQAGK